MGFLNDVNRVIASGDSNLISNMWYERETQVFCEILCCCKKKYFLLKSYSKVLMKDWSCRI